MGRLGERITSSAFESPRALGRRVKLPTGRFIDSVKNKSGRRIKVPNEPPPPFINDGVRLDQPEVKTMADKASKLIEKLTPK
jgi:hypothetical protein